jgi:hypothetical protein
MATPIANPMAAADNRQDECCPRNTYASMCFSVRMTELSMPFA